MRSRALLRISARIRTLDLRFQLRLSQTSGSYLKPFELPPKAFVRVRPFVKATQGSASNDRFQWKGELELTASSESSDLDSRSRRALLAEKLLRLLLGLIGGTLLVATIPVFFPLSWMAYLHQVLGLGEMPSEPLVEYLARSTSMLYALHGAMVLAVAIRFHQLHSLVPLIILLHMLMGIAITLIDLAAPMPWYWTVGEGPGIVFGALLTAGLWKASQIASR